MTVANNPFPLRYNGDGTTKQFPVTGYFLAEPDGTAHLTVTLRNADGSETPLIQGVHYAVSGAGNTAGGDITLQTAPTTSQKVVITRNVPDTQQTDYTQYDAFPAESHERALDKLTMRNQQRGGEVSRALLLGVTDVPGQGAYRAGGNRISNVADPINDGDVVTKGYVAELLAGLPLGNGGNDGGANPVIKWRHEGDGVQRAFTIEGITARLVNALIVTIEGVKQDSGVDFIVELEDSAIVFDEAPAEDTKIVIEAFPAGPRGETGKGVPAGGAVGQVLTKTGPEDYAAGWQNSQGGPGSGDTPLPPGRTLWTWNGNGSTKSFAMPEITPVSAASVLVSIDGVYQTPTVHYTVDTTAKTLVFDEAPYSGALITAQVLPARSVTQTNQNHSTLLGLTNDDHPLYLNVQRGDARYYTQQQVSQLISGRAPVAHSHTPDQISNLAEAIDDRVAALLTAGSNINFSYNDETNKLTISASTGSGSGGDMPGLVNNFEAVGDDTTDCTSAVTNALNSGNAFFVPSGKFKTSLASTAFGKRFYGDGQIRDAANNLRGRYFSHITAAPATLGNEDSVETAFNGDMRGCQFAVEHRVTGAATAGQPATGYLYTPETSAYYNYFYNESGHNQALNGNNGRTGIAAMMINMMQKGQGDLVAYNASAFLNSKKAGATNFLANPAAVFWNGSMSAGPDGDGGYFNPRELDLQDNGRDVAAIGDVVNMHRTNQTGALSAVWMGYRPQSNGTAYCDVAYSAVGKFKRGLDLTQMQTDDRKAAIGLKGGDRIYFNSYSQAAGNLQAGWFGNQTGTEFIEFDPSDNTLNVAVGNIAVAQFQNNNIIFAPNNTGRMQITSGDVRVLNDLQVRNGDLSSGGNYFRASAAGVVCTARLDVIGGINFSHTVSKANTAGGVATGEFLVIPFTDGTTRKIQLLYNA